MIEISIDGNAAEGFAGRIDYATYQYFEENGISMSDYSRQVDGDDLSEEDKIGLCISRRNGYYHIEAALIT